MTLRGDNMKIVRKIRTLTLIIAIAISFILIPLSPNFSNYNHKQLVEEIENIHSSAETIHNQEWLRNNDFSTQDHWFSTKGAQGDNSTVDAEISSNQANLKVLGEIRSFELSGTPNSIDSPGWSEFEKPSSYLPSSTGIDSDGCWVYHQWHEGANQFPSVHWRKNISMPVDMSDYTITSASIDVIFNATVDDDVDVLGESAFNQFGTGDYVRFYVHIADIDYKNAIPVAYNKTRDLGYDAHGLKSSIDDKSIESYGEDVLITALESAFEKDTSHANFTITLGIDIYSEDNWGDDWDTFDELRIKSCNLTFSYVKKIDQFSSVSWNQVGNTISGSNLQVTDANLQFKYRIDQDWPTALSPYSEIRILLNNNPYGETVRLSTATTSWQDAKVGGFDVTNFILKDVNITLSIQVFIANTFDFDSNITVSIDDVYLNITYVETFADYGTEAQLFLESINKTLDPFVQVVLGNTVNITVLYLDNLTRTHISGATVQLTGKVSGQIWEGGQQYTRIIDSTNLGVGIWSLTANAQKSNYEAREISFFVKVVERPTELQLFVDEVNKTLDPTVNIKFNEVMNITVFYRDRVTDQHLSEANVTMTGFGEIPHHGVYEQYTISINSNTLNFGFNVLTINAQSENYSSQVMQLYVEVYERATTFDLEVDEVPKVNDDPIQIEVNTILNLTVFYKDEETGAHLTGAIVTLVDFNNFMEIGNQFNYNLDSGDLNLGFNVLTILAQFGNYQTQTFQVYVEVYNIASNLTLKVDGSYVGALQTIQVEVDQFKNFTVYYRDNATQQHISGAIVSLNWDNFTEVGSQYYYNLDTNSPNLDQGITIVSIEARFTNYQTQTIQIYIEVTERVTVLEVYIDGSEINATDTIKRDVNQILNLTVFYRDDLTSQHLTGASLTVVGGNLSETLTEHSIYNQYNYSLNTNDLDEGITILTVIALLNNYQPRSFQFYVKVSRRASEISLYYNSVLKTGDPVLSLPFGSILNVTVIYSDNQTQTHISGATIQMINKTDPSDFYDLNEDVTKGQYTLLLDTSELKVGVNLFTIVAHANNYLAKTLNLRITLNKISTTISTTTGERFFNIKPNERFTMSIELIDVDFGGRITNAIVTYWWAYGRGNLTDPDADGIYEAELNNIPPGTYEIIITASAGDAYSFEIYRITLTVESETTADFTLLFISLAGGLVALVIGFTLYEVRFKYPPLVRKSRKIRKKISKGKSTKPVKDLTSRDDLVKEHLESSVELFQFEKKHENGLKEK
ncbi:MAG: hypothetical protein ACFE96_00315 [Candidatus Hermodarchaeota archaeon]